MNTSHNGHSAFMTPPSCCVSRLMRRALLGMRKRRLAYPCAFLPRIDARSHPGAIARSVALDDLVEFLPVDLAKLVVAAALVERQLVVGHAQAKVVGLRHGLVDEALTKLVV